MKISDFGENKGEKYTGCSAAKRRADCGLERLSIDGIEMGIDTNLLGVDATSSKDDVREQCGRESDELEIELCKTGKTDA